MADDRPSLLVVDDQTPYWEALVAASAQGQFPYAVAFAASGGEARLMLAARPFAAALVRHQLPDGSAFELLPQLDCPVVVAVAEEDELPVAARALHAGFSDYLLRDPGGEYVELLAAKLAAAARHVAVVAQLRESGQELTRKSQDLQATLESMSQGISKVEPDGRISLMNRRTLELLDLPESLMSQQLKLVDVLRFQHERGDFGQDYELVQGPAQKRIRDAPAQQFSQQQRGQRARAVPAPDPLRAHAGGEDAHRCRRWRGAHLHRCDPTTCRRRRRCATARSATAT